MNSDSKVKQRHSIARFGKYLEGKGEVGKGGVTISKAMAQSRFVMQRQGTAVTRFAKA